MIDDRDWKLGGLTLLVLKPMAFALKLSHMQLDTSILVQQHRSSIAVALRSTLHMSASDSPMNHRAVSHSHKNMLGSLGHDDTSSRNQ